jgi:hypothetical protein
MNQRRVITLSFVILSLLIMLSLIGCTTPASSPSSDGGSDDSGAYASQQQELGGKGACPAKGKTQVWYLCFSHNLTFTFPTLPGPFNFYPDGVPCTELVVSSGGTDSAKSFTTPFTLNGKGENDKIICTLTGDQTLTASASGKCKGGVETLTIKEEWKAGGGHIKCVYKDGKGHGTDQDIQLGDLGTSTRTLSFPLKDGPSGNCQVFPLSGVLSGSFMYCLQTIPSTGIVPLVP